MHHIQIPWKDRASYLRITLATLFEAARNYPGEFDITIYNNESSESVPEIALQDPRVRIVKLPVTNCHNNYYVMFEQMFNRYPPASHIINIDADAVIHPEFFFALDDMIRDCEDFGVLSLFNWDSHPEDTGRYKEKYIPRKHSSFFCAVVRREAWDMFTPPPPEGPWDYGCADGHFTTFVHNSTPYKVYSTLRSYMENIGFLGKHAGESDDGISNTVKARRFYP